MQTLNGEIPSEKDRLYLAYRLRDISIAARIPDLETLSHIVEEIHEIFALGPVKDNGKEVYENRKSRGF